jgi:menaquinone-dependent protoporphyrinogen oxidase
VSDVHRRVENIVRELLIVYGTAEGQTRKIAQFLANEAPSLGAAPTITEAGTSPDLDITRYGLVIVAASVHMERHQLAVTDFVKQHRPALEKIPSAFLSVSLSAAGDNEERSDAWGYTRQFSSETDWRPTVVQVVPGAVRFSEHDFFKRWAMRRVAKDKRVPRDQDYEFTDWNDLRRFLKDFLQLH